MVLGNVEESEGQSLAAWAAAVAAAVRRRRLQKSALARTVERGRLPAGQRRRSALDGIEPRRSARDMQVEYVRPVVVAGEPVPQPPLAARLALGSGREDAFLRA